MDLRDKILKAISAAMTIDYARLEDDDGISGFVVSPQFEKMSTLDRQKTIEGALRKSSEPLTNEERRKILMVAGLTPAEYDAVGARIRIHKVEDLTRGRIRVLLHGGHSDAEYVRGTLNCQKGFRTTEPEPVPGAIGLLMSFEATGTASNPLTKQGAIRILNGDKYIHVMPNA